MEQGGKNYSILFGNSDVRGMSLVFTSKTGKQTTSFFSLNYAEACNEFVGPFSTLFRQRTTQLLLRKYRQGGRNWFDRLEIWTSDLPLDHLAGTTATYNQYISLTLIQGWFKASWAEIREDTLIVSILVMRAFASWVTVSHSGEGN